MGRPFVPRLLWRAGHFTAASGWPFAAGLLLLVLSAAVSHFALVPTQQRAHDLAAAIAELRLRPRHPAVDTSALTPSVQLAAFYRHFPAQDSAPDLLSRLYAAAERQDVLLEQGSYRLLQAGADARLARYEIALPVRGDYVALRSFIAQALADLPNLSLDAITLIRASADAPVVEAELRFTLYLGPQ
jgi:hypothetical protein